jgi:16S rRNA (guanine527-N7)-methyltransferase
MFHVKHEAWTREAATYGVRPSEAQWQALEGYESLLLATAVPRGMVAASDRDRLWERHILDGLRAAGEIPSAARVADMGSGAGIPGVPLAIVRPDSRFVLIEPRRGRVAFLEAVVDDLHLTNVTVFLGRAGDVDGGFDVAMARALAAPIESWEIAEPLLGPAGRLIYWAGKGFDVGEVTDKGVSCRLSTRSGLAEGGPLVIMAPR